MLVLVALSLAVCFCLCFYTIRKENEAYKWFMTGKLGFYFELAVKEDDR